MQRSQTALLRRCIQQGYRKPQGLGQTVGLTVVAQFVIKKDLTPVIAHPELLKTKLVLHDYKFTWRPARF